LSLLGKFLRRSAIEALVHEFDGIAVGPIAGFIGFGRPWPKASEWEQEIQLSRRDPEAY